MSAAMGGEGDTSQAQEAEAIKPEQKQTWAMVDPESLLQGKEKDDGEQVSLRSFLIFQKPDIEVVPHFVSSAEMQHLRELAEGFWPIPRQAIEMVPLRFRQTKVVEGIEARMAAIAGLPVDHLERVRVARYFPCSPSQERPLHGLGSSKSVFAWLGELPQDCGAFSAFPALGLACTPRSGTALIWHDPQVTTSLGASEDPKEPPPAISPFGMDAIPPHEASGIVMYGLLGVFRPSPVRYLIEPTSCVLQENAAQISMPELDDSQQGSLHKFALESAPPVFLAPKFCLVSEVEHLLNLSPAFVAAEGMLPVVLGLLQFGGDNVANAVEARAVALAELPYESMGQMRVVSSGRIEGHCNRGCGSKAMYICLSETDEVFFPYLGLTICMRKGDAILWPNVSEQSEGKWVEDTRATRFHLSSSVGLEVMFCDWAVRIREIQRPPPLELGSECKLSTSSFKVTEAIGMGSFGMVWGAQRLEEEESTGSVVIKETLCQGPEDKEPARETYEYKLLQELSEVSKKDASALCALSRIPTFVDSLAELVGPSLWRVRFAMGKVPGVPMDNFIIKQLEERRVSQESGKITSKAAKQHQFTDACHFAKELVSQLAPTLAQISKLAIHRDVNSRNVLVDGSLENPKFYLVDFGLAVSRDAWFGPSSPDSFHNFDIGGDCRYWPAAGWLMFLGGYDEMKKYPVLESEYSHLLDLHALGVIAIEGLAALSPKPANLSSHENQQVSMASDAKKPSVEESENPSGEPVCEKKEGSSHELDDHPTSCSVGEDGLSDEVRQLLQLFNRYWYDAHRHWEIMFNAFRTTRDFGPVRRWIAENAVHNVVAQQMCWVRQALISSLKSDSLSEIADAKPCFLALLQLISAGLCEDLPDTSKEASGESDNRDGAKQPRSWEAVCAAVNDTSVSRQ